jgi:anthranilate phosphoribosyltransferase
MALYSTGDYKNYDEAYGLAVDSLESGKAYKGFQKLIAMQ